MKLADTFREKISVAILDLDEARENYIQHYPALVAASERDLGELFDRSQYPPIDHIRDLFTTKISYWPIPDSNHFLAEISEEAAKEAKDSIESEIEQRLIDATYDMVKRAKEVVSIYIDKLEKFRINDENGKSENNFRDSLVDNLKDTACLIEQMNMTDNPQINKVIKDLRRLYGFAAWGLRKRHTIREKALSAGKEVLLNLTMLNLKDQEVSDMVADASDYMDT